ncbi:MAG: hypothetical protein WA935_06790 [Sphingopyxis granuli]|uniref:hypothetical protein n=1 Tax=Sphingopyxis sp. SCN 67-31 TaxID=1660142 RepID=UPI00257EA10D|nr:hypothetical protein [Sphingopyxis sp. SCN 67-31]
MDRLLPCICRDRAGSFNLVLKTREFGYDVMLVARGQETIFCWATASAAAGELQTPQQAAGDRDRGMDRAIFPIHLYISAYYLLLTLRQSEKGLSSGKAACFKSDSFHIFLWRGIDCRFTLCSKSRNCSREWR